MAYNPPIHEGDPLTPVDITVLTGLANGKTLREISNEYHYSYYYIRGCVIYFLRRKLGVHNNEQAVLKAYLKGLIKIKEVKWDMVVNKLSEGPDRKPFSQMLAGRLFTFENSDDYDVYLVALDPDHGNHMAVNIRNGNSLYVNPETIVRSVIAAELN